MNYKLSKLARAIIIFNVALTLIVASFHGYNVTRINETNNKIQAFMAEKQVIRVTAIRMLEREGVELFLGDEFITFAGLFLCLLTLFLLYRYAKTDGFFYGFFAAFFGLLATFIGGLMLFYVILSGKSETGENKQEFTIKKDDWEKYIFKKSQKN